jgi:hypothetical protein
MRTRRDKDILDVELIIHIKNKKKDCATVDNIS